MQWGRYYYWSQDRSSGQFSMEWTGQWTGPATLWYLRNVDGPPLSLVPESGWPLRVPPTSLDCKVHNTGGRMAAAGRQSRERSREG